MDAVCASEALPRESSCYQCALHCTDLWAMQNSQANFEQGTLKPLRLRLSFTNIGCLKTGHLGTSLMSWCVQVVDEYSNDVHFVEIDIEEDPEIAEAGGIMGTPCVQFFKNKQLIKYVTS